MTRKNKSASSRSIDAYESWAAGAQAGTYEPIPYADIVAMFEWTARHGSGNGWTGTTGTPAAMLRRLLRERVHLLQALGVNEHA